MNAATGGGWNPSDCGICQLEGPPRRAPELVVAESTRWVVRHHEPPVALAGWLLLCSRRHVQGPARLDDDEAADFGIALRDVTRAIESATGALRVYTITFGEGAQHLHAHCVPRLEQRADSAAWKIADLYRAVERGECKGATPDEIASAVASTRAVLLQSAPQRWRAATT